MELNKQFLATTGISEMWDFSATGMLFLGPWCLSKKENRQLAQRILYSVIPSPWRPTTKIKEAADTCRGIYEQILSELSDQLNLLHHVSYPQKYWRILIGPWLSHFIQILYDRYIRIENAFTISSNLYTCILPKRLCELSVIDTYDFMSIKGKAANDYFNLKLFSLIFGLLYPDKAVERDFLQFQSEGRITPGIGYLKKTFYKIKTLKDNLGHASLSLSDMYNFDWEQMLSLELRSQGAICFINVQEARFKEDYGAYSSILRASLVLNKNTDRFQSLLRQLIPQAIPMCYIENFTKYKTAVKPRNVLGIGSAVGWYFNENFKFLAAESALAGTQLLDFQHGGGFGMLLATPTEDSALENDKYYTWGWRDETNEKTIPLASPYLSKLKDTHCGSKKTILFVGNNTAKYLSRFTTSITPDDIQQYFLDKKRFFHSLGTPPMQALLYRPYQEVGWDEIEMVKDLIPDMRIEVKGKLFPYLQKSRLIVIDHLGTTNLEALIINAPSIWFWDPEINLIRSQAESYFDLLRDAGMLYRTPEEAAKKVNEIHNDAIEWWRDTKIQKARNTFCDKFAASSNNWQKEWMNTLNVYK